ncbi:MAG: outer membrane beta-barrel protein [Dysgonamonadaceae bacterium]|jgi:hypothetical protein|nr:outer membrane beta-barrel protein [Dysgonamonadaceae bacterium]
MKVFGHLLLFLLCIFPAVGQNNTLSGTVLDKADKQAIISGSISLLATNDSSFVAGAITNVNGVFSFKNIRPGNYILKITYLGYNPLIKNVTIRNSQPALNVGTLYLEADAILLQEAIVEGKKPEIVVKNDTIEYDAASYKVPENSAVEELLKKMPGFEVDKDGKITANGKEVKRIMVDGKEFFTDDPQVASKNLPADMVEKLQLLDRKSERAQMTGFDDGEEETIINLTIRPGMKKGTLGNALVGSGSDLQNDHDWRYQAGAFVNHMQNSNRYTLIAGKNNNNNMGAGDLGINQFGAMRGGGSGGVTESNNLMLGINQEFSPKATLNGDVRYNTFDRNSGRNVSQATLSKENSQLENTLTRNSYISDNLSANLRFEWKPDTSNTLIFRPNIRYNRSNSAQSETAQSYNGNDGSRILDTEAHSMNQRTGYNFGGSLNYAHRFDKRGRVLSIDMQGSLSDNDGWGNSYTDYTKYVPSDKLPDYLDQRSESDSKSNSFRTTISFVEPIGHNNFIQALYRINYADSKNINSTYNLWEIDPLLALSLASDSMAILVPNLSRSVARNSTEQRFGLSFKAERKKYNYTIGFNIDPTRSLNETYQPSSDNLPEYSYWFDERLPNRQGNELVSEPIRRNVVNFSPVFNYRYLFGQRSNLDIRLEGETSQPSPNQLRVDTLLNTPTEWVVGNPNLKPGYSNDVRIRFQKYVPETQLMYNLNLNGSVSFNDVTSIISFPEPGIRLTEYENINGNWNSRFSGMFNTPLRNKRFSVGMGAGVTYQNQNTKTDNLKNTMRNFSVFDNVNANYRSDLFDLGFNFSINHNNISYTVQPEKNQKTYNYRLNAYTTWYLPYNWLIQSDISWTERRGYSEGFNIPETTWNATVTKQVFNKKYGTGSLKLQIFDILQDRKMISNSSTTSGYQTSEDLVVLPSYFMCSFIYKFTVFPKSGSTTEDDLRPQWRRPEGPPGDRGGRGGGGQRGGGGPPGY